MSVTIPCKHCHGTGGRPLAPALELVYRQLLKNGPAGPWKDLNEVRAKLEKAGVKTTPASLSAKLAKLVEHGLVTRAEASGRGGRIYWRAGK